MSERNSSITDIPGILVGQVEDPAALTGCSVVICKEGAIGGVDQRGGAPGTRETDALRPMHLVEKVHAVVLAGGSAYGLDASSGVMRWLEEQGVGFDTGVAKVPIVSSAILFDLAVGSPSIRPDAEMGYRACQRASQAPPQSGNYGAGCGATVGKVLGMSYAMKGGIGSASIQLAGQLRVAALVAVNAFGDILDPTTNQLIAGARNPHPTATPFADTLEMMKILSSPSQFSSPHNTVIGVVATNARLTKEQANKVAQMAHNGLARTIRPSHTMFDGDTLFCLAVGDLEADVSTIGAFAAEAVSQAILNAIHSAQSISGIPAALSL